MRKRSGPVTQYPSSPSGASMAAASPPTMKKSTAKASICETSPGCSSSRPLIWSTVVSVAIGVPPNGRGGDAPGSLLLWIVRARGVAVTHLRPVLQLRVGPLDGDAVAVDRDPCLVRD